MSEAASKRPAVIETRVIGHSVKGRDIVAWRVGQPYSGRGVSRKQATRTGPNGLLRAVWASR